MSSMTIELPEPLQAFVNEQVAEHEGLTPSEFIVEMLRQEQKRRARARLEELLMEGLNSGPGIKVDAQFWRDRHAELEAHFAEQANK